MLDHGIFKGFQSFPSPSHYSRLSAGYCSTGADEALQRRAAGQGAVCFREEDHVCCPHGVRHRPRASVLVRDQHDEDALRKKQMPLVQNKVTLSRTILGMSMTPCKGSRSHDIVPPARCVNLQFPRASTVLFIVLFIVQPLSAAAPRLRQMPLV